VQRAVWQHAPTNICAHHRVDPMTAKVAAMNPEKDTR